MSNGDTYHALWGWFTSTFIIDRETSCAPPAVRIYPPYIFLAANRAVDVPISLQVSLQLPTYAQVNPPNPWWKIGYPILSSIDDPCTNKNRWGQSANPSVPMAYSTHFEAPEAGISQVIGCQSWIGTSYANAHIPPATYQLRYSSPGRKSASVTYYFCHNGVETGDIAAQGTLTFLVSGPTLRVRAGTVAQPGDPGTESATAGSSPVTASIPLGAQFFIQLTKTDLTGVPSTFTLSESVPSPALTEAALFKDAVVLPFDAGAVSHTKYFRAVHLGRSVLTIAPSPPDPALQPVKVIITVTRPVKLGTAAHQVDALAIDYGHRRGIPPQFLKAQMQRESGFDPEAYRYEPLKVDMAVKGGPVPFWLKTPYSSYRLAIADPSTQGEYLLDADVAPRSKYNIFTDTTRTKTRAIEPTDHYVSALTIYQANNGREHWSTHNPDRAAAVAKNPAMLDFTAQTPLASSYGLLQVLYTTAIAPMKWDGFAYPGVPGKHHPWYLFDTQFALANGGGSVAVGSGYLRRMFLPANRKLSRTNLVFALPADFDTAFARAFTAYQIPGRLTKLKTDEELKSSTYGLDIVYTRAPRFLPPPTAIFQQ